MLFDKIVNARVTARAAAAELTVAVHAAMTTQDEDATTTVSSWRYSAARAAGRRTRSEGRGVRRGRRCRRRTTRYHAANSDCSAAGRKGAWSVVQPRLCVTYTGGGGGGGGRGR